MALVQLCYKVTPIVKNSSTTESPNNLCPISYTSKTLSKTESNYSNIEREFFGVVFVMTHFKHFTYERPVTIISDHKPLVSLFKKSLTSSSPHLSRMLFQILDYDLNIVYQEGSKMHLSNALSRLSSHKPNKGLTGMDITVHEIKACTNFSAVSGQDSQSYTVGSRPTSVKITYYQWFSHWY